MADSPNRIIATVAKQTVGALGLRRVGRSRTWVDDHGWFVILVEFQPSGFEKGSYLNVGVCWLLIERDYYSFDYGYRVGRLYVRYRNDGQFTDDFKKLADAAIARVGELRREVSTFDASLTLLRAMARNPPPARHPTEIQMRLGILCGVAGLADEADAAFAAALAQVAPGDHECELHHRTRELRALLSDRDAFRREITRVVDVRRANHKLPPVPPSFP